MISEWFVSQSVTGVNGGSFYQFTGLCPCKSCLHAKEYKKFLGLVHSI